MLTLPSGTPAALPIAPPPGPNADPGAGVADAPDQSAPASAIALRGAAARSAFSAMLAAMRATAQTHAAPAGTEGLPDALALARDGGQPATESAESGAAVAGDNASLLAMLGLAAEARPAGATLDPAAPANFAAAGALAANHAVTPALTHRAGPDAPGGPQAQPGAGRAGLAITVPTERDGSAPGSAADLMPTDAALASDTRLASTPLAAAAGMQARHPAPADTRTSTGSGASTLLMAAGERRDATITPPAATLESAAAAPGGVAAVPAPPAPMAALAATPPAAPAPVQVTLSTPLHSPYFAHESAQQVAWLATHGIEHARINVTPAELGPIEVRISVRNDEALVNFAVTEPSAAAAIEDALPRLREMLAADGITLGQTSVETGPRAREGKEEALAQHQHRKSLAEADAARAPPPDTAGTRTRGTGLVDLFA